MMRLFIWLDVGERKRKRKKEEKSQWVRKNIYLGGKKTGKVASKNLIPY